MIRRPRTPPLLRPLPFLFLALLLAGCGAARSGAGSWAGGRADASQCAPFARAQTGLALYGPAADWWAEAAGRYPRGPLPMPGGVLVFRRSARLPWGHVAVVSRLVSPREIRVLHANWVPRRIGRDDPVVDVSATNDWSLVRVWWAPVSALGHTPYPTYGFVAPP